VAAGVAFERSDGARRPLRFGFVRRPLAFVFRPAAVLGFAAFASALPTRWYCLRSLRLNPL
jgi:hypothetical protein